MSRIQVSRFSLAMLLLFSTHLSAQQVGEHVSITGVIDDDLYLAGGQVDMYAAVDGDVVVAGGQLNIEGDVRADITAAGGDIDLRGTVADDVRIAGGNVRVLAKIADDLVAAGGRLQIGPTASIGGSAWISAGDVLVGGRISEALHVNGGRVIVTGTVAGNAEIWAESIEISSSAVIMGDLHYRSPHPAVIAEGARIEGEVTHTPVDVPIAPLVAGLLFVYAVIVLSMVIAGIALYLVFPGVAEGCSKIISEKPWASLGYGLAVIAGVPVVIVLLFSTGVGALLALLLLAVYLVLLLSGYITGAYYFADVGLRKLNKDEAGKTARVVSLSLAIVALSIVNIIPVLGSLVNWLVLLAGVGALMQRVTADYVRD